ncbi:tRNA methyltransferase 10 C [Tyrophagus putrescentiae]|nr:tRNA methyltransferase 10 C [Tyrophagus putrescentiae]
MALLTTTSRLLASLKTSFAFRESICYFRQTRCLTINPPVWSSTKSISKKGEKPPPKTTATHSFGPTFETLSLDTFESLYASKPENRSKVEHILALYEHEKYTGTSEVPTVLTTLEMADLLAVFPDERELKRTFKFFFKRECARFNTATKKAARKISVLEAKMTKYKTTNLDGVKEWDVGIWNSQGNLEYGLWHNSLMSRITKQSVRDYRQRHLLRQAALFGQKLIIDLDYDHYMKLYESRLLGTQIGILYYENRVNRDYPDCLPFDVHFTNCSKATQSLASITKHIKRADQLGGYFHSGSYLDYPHLFPRHRLVYLSPHARESITSYSHDDIYILGGYNDRSSHMKVSNVKAQQEGIRCYRLPLDESVLWRQGSRNLCLNQVAAILQAVKSTGNWKESIAKWTPQRKMKSSEELMLEDELRKKATDRRIKSIQRTFNIKVADKVYKL